MRKWRYILDRLDLDPRRGKGRNGRLTPRSWPLNPYVDAFHSHGHRFSTTLLSGDGGREGRRLLRALETSLAGATPHDGISGAVRDGDEGVVERRLDVRDAVRLNDLLAPLPRWCCFSQSDFRPCRCWSLLGIALCVVRRRLVSHSTSSAQPSYRRLPVSVPYGCERWYASSALAPAVPGDAEDRDNNRCP